jgi:signal transduction histidine kinase
MSQMTDRSQSVFAASAGATALSPALSLPTLALAAAIVYYGGVRLGMALTLSSEPVSTLWPANALLLGILLLTPPRRWWVLLLCAFPAHLLAEIDAGVPLPMSALWFVSNSAEATLGAALFLRFLGGPPRLDRVRDVSILVAVAGIVAPVVSSFLDAGFVALTGWRYSTYWQVWEARTLSNSLAALIVIPLIAALDSGVLARLRQMRIADSVETLVILLGLSAASLAAFHQPQPPNQSPVLMYAPLPFLIWAAVRRGTSFVALCTAILALFAIEGVLNGRGPFTQPRPERAALALQTSLVIASASLMLLAAALAELRHARRLALSRLEQLDLAHAAAKVGTWEWDFERDRISWTSVDAHGTAAIQSGSSSLRDFLKLVEPHDRSVVIRAFDKSRGGTCEAEFRIRTSAGASLWIRSQGRTVHGTEDAPGRMIGVYGDITRRKSEEAQLAMQRDQVARLNRASLLGVLSGTLAHDLLQPLTAILSNAEAARVRLHQDAENLQEVDEALVDIISDNLRMIEVIRHVRALFERGEVTYSLLDVNGCVETALTLERSYLIAHGATVDVRLGQGLPPVLMNGVQLQQVLINLIVNACEAMDRNPEHERRIEVLTSTPNEGVVEIVIGDNGVGMESTEVIFEPFYTTKPHGIGLGLSICRTIITAYGGKLWAANKPTRGAALHLVLPAADPTETTDAAQVTGRLIRDYAPQPERVP